MVVTYLFPGQGSQQKGMGGNLFDEFPEVVAKADGILGYSIKELCLEDPGHQLVNTAFTQPALYVVNALSYLKHVKETGKKPDFVAGHSLGEFDALFAAGAFDFETGLRLVKKRGELMSKAVGGGMAAVIGLSAEKVSEILERNTELVLDIANLNAPSQTVLAGKRQDIENAAATFEAHGCMYIVLNVSGAFHSRYMQPAKEEFAEFVAQQQFFKLEIPVISNVTARPYRDGDLKKNIIDQITSPVQWTDTIRYLMGLGDIQFEEFGPGTVLTRLAQTIQKEATPFVGAKMDSETNNESLLVTRGIETENDSPSFKSIEASKTDAKLDSFVKTITAHSLGNQEFKRDYNLTYAYLVGSMYRGISSKEMVVKLGKAGFMGFLGAGGLDLNELENSIRYMQQELNNGQPFGVNLLHNLTDDTREDKKVDLFLKHGVRNIEASAYLTITPALVRYRAAGLSRNQNDSVSCKNRIIAKVSRPEVAEAFLSPAPNKLIEKLVQNNIISANQAQLLQEVPVADDLCVEADSGGHTDAGVAYALMPVMLKLRDEIMAKHHYRKKIRIGAAGGIGTPEAAAAAFVLGADFILTGSINQCTVEAGTSDAAKDLLQRMNVQDTEYAPAGDMFELGGRVQVLKKGLFFPARANKLFELYRAHESLDDIDEKTKVQLQDKYFKCSFEQLFQKLKPQLPKETVEKAENNAKFKMALLFKSYFTWSSQLALSGSEESKVDYQIHSGPALGAFNQWVKGTDLEDWRNRNVDVLGHKIMNGAAELLTDRFQAMSTAA